MSDLPQQIQNIFFDLDGTLTDPREGIVGCIRHALAALGHPSPPEETLLSLIGPPLRIIFERVLELSDRDEIERAVGIYRDRYASVGLFENVPYAGIPELLDSLQGTTRLYVVTSKPKVYAQQIVEHFGMGAAFAGIFGPELDGTFDDKKVLLKHVLRTTCSAPGSAVMIGDRREDIVAARVNGVASIGVIYGFGSLDELTSAGASRISTSPADLKEMLLCYTEANQPRIQKALL